MPRGHDQQRSRKTAMRKCVGKRDRLPAEEAVVHHCVTRKREKAIDCAFCTDLFWTDAQTEARVHELRSGSIPMQPHTVFETFLILKKKLEVEEDAKNAKLREVERGDEAYRLSKSLFAGRPHPSAPPAPQPEPETIYNSPRVVPTRTMNLQAEPQPDHDQALRRRGQYFKRHAK